MRRLVTVLVVAAVVVLGGWLADNAVRGRAEERAAAAIQARLGLDQSPQVTIGGFPFSLALVTKTVPSARISAASVPLAVSGTRVHVTGVLVDSEAISLDGDRVRLARVSGSGVLSYGDLAELSGVPTSYAEDGRLRLNYTAQIAGRQLGVWVSATPVIAADGSAIELTRLRLDPDSASVPLTKAQLGRLVASIPLRLPDGVRLTALTPSEGGVAVAGQASDLAFTLS